MVLCLRPTVVIKELRFQYRLERPAIYLRSPAALRRRHLSSNSAPGPANSPRKQITVLSDDGRVQWQDLTRLEKVARTTQQTFNVGLVIGGFFLTVCLVFYLRFLIAKANRELSYIYFIPRSSPQIARPVISIGLSIRFEGMLGHLNYLDQSRRSEPLESLHSTNGLERGLSRKVAQHLSSK